MVSIPACHAGDPGSIPGQEVFPHVKKHSLSPPSNNGFLVRPRRWLRREQLSSPTDESQQHASTAEPPSGTKIQKTVARKARAASPKGKSSGGKDTRQAKRKPTHELNAAVKAQKSTADRPERPQVGRYALQGHVEQQRRVELLHQRRAFVPLAPPLAPYSPS